MVTIDPATVQNMNVTDRAGERRDLAREIRTVGYLDYDQEKMVSVTTKYKGWVEKVFVNYIGEPVRRGQPLFELYSPELVQTQQELLSAIDYARRMEDAPADARARAEALVAAARGAPRLLGHLAGQIERLSGRRGHPHAHRDRAGQRRGDAAHGRAGGDGGRRRAWSCSTSPTSPRSGCRSRSSRTSCRG